MAFLPGAKIGMVGPNGAGKSSILKIMAPGEEGHGDVVEDDLVTVGFARLNHLVDVLSHCSSAPFVRV